MTPDVDQDVVMTSVEDVVPTTDVVPATEDVTAAAIADVVPEDASAVVPPVEVTPPVTDAEAGDTLAAAIDFAGAGAWTSMIGCLIMLLVWVLRKINILTKLPDAYTPWVALALGAITAFGLVLAGGATWGVALVQGLGGGLLAPALWELIFKHVNDKLKTPVEDAPVEG